MICQRRSNSNIDCMYIAIITQAGSNAVSFCLFVCCFFVCLLLLFVCLYIAIITQAGSNAVSLPAVADSNSKWAATSYMRVAYPSPKICLVRPLNNKHLHIFWIYSSHRVCLYMYIPFMQYACVISVPLADSNSIWAATSSMCIAYILNMFCLTLKTFQHHNCYLCYPNFAEPQIWFEMFEWLYLKYLLGAVSTSPLYRTWGFHKRLQTTPTIRISLASTPTIRISLANHSYIRIFVEIWNLKFCHAHSHLPPSFPFQYLRIWQTSSQKKIIWGPSSSCCYLPSYQYFLLE